MRILHQFMIFAPAAGVWLQVFLAVVILTRKTWTKCPIFVAYSFVNLFQSLVLLALRTWPASSYAYFYCFWSFEALSVLLGFGVVYEVFRALLEPHLALRRLARVSFRCALLGLIVLACATVYVRATGPQHPIVTGVIIMEQGTRIVEVGLLMFLFVFSGAFGLHWRQLLFGIALGLGVFTSAELAGVTAFTHFGALALTVASVVRILSFDVSMLIWIGYVLAPERVTVPIELPKTAQLERWNQAIMELIHQ
jgi:hypothetical protein